MLTDVGLVPIEDVTTEMKLWDGESWVSHDGVIFKGEREVITYEGLTATPDHYVWIEGESEPIQFEEAAACGAHLVQTGYRPYRHKRKLCKGQSAICNPLGKSVEQTDFCSEPFRAEILALQPFRCNTQALGGTESGADNRRCGKCGIQQKKKLENHIRTARLYDIRNAGRHHRFTVSGKLVHNCGYGGSVGALKAMGALEMGLSEDELQPLVDSWRAANQHITQLWWDIDAAVKQAVIYKSRTETHGFPIYYKSGMLFIDLPSGRRLCYVKPKMGINQFGSDCVTYEGTTTGKWGRIESYGPKFVENIVQAVSRDILAYAMRTLSHCFIVGHVHDELIIECDPRVSLEAICEQMSRTPPWIPGLLLRADGYECEFYQKQ